MVNKSKSWIVRSSILATEEPYGSYEEANARAYEVFRADLTATVEVVEVVKKVVVLIDPRHATLFTLGGPFGSVPSRT